MRSVTSRAFALAILALLAVTSIANAQQEGVYGGLFHFQAGGGCAHSAGAVVFLLAVIV
jgi:hypothetical protein